MPLSGRQVSAVSDALLSAYNRSSLDFMLQTRLNERLDIVAREGTFAEEVHDLINWAQQHGLTLELIRAAHDENPGNPLLVQLLAESKEWDLTRADRTISVRPLQKYDSFRKVGIILTILIFISVVVAFAPAIGRGISLLQLSNAPSNSQTVTSSSSTLPSNLKPEIEWVAIPAGPFTFGLSDLGMEKTLEDCGELRSDCEIGWFDQEQPERTVALDSYEISIFEVSNLQYEQCVEIGVCESRIRNLDSEIEFNPAYFEPEYPAMAVKFSQARVFCAWIGGRLPTEEEWEKAARGKDNRLYPWGDEFNVDPVRANLALSVPSDMSKVRPEPIKSHIGDASPYGVVNMSGNVTEWTTSLRNGKYVLRGGSWYSPYIEGRVTDRGTNRDPGYVSYDVGFRCVR